eukprot:scaffold3012_cov106-Isochrysis_galbana.AAC.1
MSVGSMSGLVGCAAAEGGEEGGGCYFAIFSPSYAPSPSVDYVLHKVAPPPSPPYRRAVTGAGVKVGGGRRGVGELGESEC